jgi:hypothetical protein
MVILEPPLYVMKAILGTYNKCRCRLGGISAVLTLTYKLLSSTSLITLSADNHEGGIFALMLW